MSLDWLLLPQLQAFAASGYDVVAMSAPDDHVAAISAAGIEHVSIPALTRAVSPARDWRALRQLQRAFREVAPDIVHTHNPKPGLLGRIAAQRAGVPVVVNTVHGLYATAEATSVSWVAGQSPSAGGQGESNTGVMTTDAVGFVRSRVIVAE